MNLKKITSIPLIVNTSFNLNYEPIVCSPKDAISSFFNSGLDFLCIEGILIENNDKTWLWISFPKNN